MLSADTASLYQIQKLIFDAITPTPAYAIQGLNENNSISPSAIRLVELDEDMQESPYRAIGYDVERLDSGGYQIGLCDAPPTEAFRPQVNIVIKVTLPNEEVLYAPFYLTSNSEPIFVDINSHYIITRLFDKVESSNQLEDLLPCSSAGECSTQFQAKADLLRFIYITADAFDIAFESGDTISDALAKLSGTFDYRVTVDKALEEILRAPSPIVDGAASDTSSLPGINQCLTVSKSYHSNYFRLGLGDNLPNDGRDEVVISSSLSESVDVGEIGNSTPRYPQLERTSFIYTSQQREGLFAEIPYRRNKLILTTSSGSLNSNDYIQFFSAIRNIDSNEDRLPLITDTYLNTQGNILFDRAIPAFIPFDLNGPSGFGWSQNPIYSKLYQSSTEIPRLNSSNECITEESDSPKWLTGAYFGGGSIYQQDGSGSFLRDEKLESLNFYTWEVHGEKTDDTFSKNDISGKEYGVISYGVLFDNQDPLLTVSADTYRWSAGTFDLLETQPSTHYQSRALERSSDTTVVVVGPNQTPGTTNRTYFTIKETQSNGEDITSGLIGIDGGTRAPRGHVNQRGNNIALVQDSLSKGRGMILATQLRTFPPSFPTANAGGETYRLQGNVIELFDDLDPPPDDDPTDANVFRNVSGTSLVISEGTGGKDCDATLELTYVKSTHDIEDNIVTSIDMEVELQNEVDQGLPPAFRTVVSGSNTACSISGGEIEISFPSILENNKSLTLKGFMSKASNSDSEPGNLINLLWIQSDALGLVFAQRDYALNYADL